MNHPLPPVWPYDRASMHKNQSLWAQFAVTGTDQWFPSRQAAKAAEDVAISTEMPLFNRYPSAPGAKERLENYLVERDREDLLTVIANWRWDRRAPYPNRHANRVQK